MASQCKSRNALLARAFGILVPLFLLPIVFAQDTAYVVFTDSDGNKIRLPANRQPALYTQSFGDCLGGSLLEVSRFDAAYYQDNMTVAFHMQGEAQVTNQTLMSMFSPHSCFAGLTLQSVYWRLCVRRKAV